MGFNLSCRYLIAAAIVGLAVVLTASTYWYIRHHHLRPHRTPQMIAVNPTSGSSQPRPARPHPTAANAQLPRGSPALKPGPTGSPYTLDDVREFVLAHPLGARTDKSSAVTITRLEFLTSKEVSPLLKGATTGFADDYKLCYVELAGNFTFFGPQGATRTYQRAFEVFDAQTGNFLMMGGLRN